MEFTSLEMFQSTEYVLPLNVRIKYDYNFHAAATISAFLCKKKN
jgi:hypothetical protein